MVYPSSVSMLNQSVPRNSFVLGADMRGIVGLHFNVGKKTHEHIYENVKVIFFVVVVVPFC